MHASTVGSKDKRRNAALANISAPVKVEQLQTSFLHDAHQKRRPLFEDDASVNSPSSVIV